jgi:hypothetical protein
VILVQKELRITLRKVAAAWCVSATVAVASLQVQHLRARQMVVNDVFSLRSAETEA